LECAEKWYEHDPEKYLTFRDVRKLRSFIFSCSELIMTTTEHNIPKLVAGYQVIDMGITGDARVKIKVN